MALQNRFNLIDEPWIPVVDAGLVSIKDVFCTPDLGSLGGTPVQKIAMTKLLLAIAQAAATPENNGEWATMGPHGLAERSWEYLEKWHDRFFLFGERPFLQLSILGEIEKELSTRHIKNNDTTLKKNLLSMMPEFVDGTNAVRLFHSQVPRALSDAEKALLIVQVCGFALAGKADTSVRLSSRDPQKLPFDYVKSRERSHPGAFLGYLHNFLWNRHLLTTLWLNLFSGEQIREMRLYAGVGTPPWEKMPEGMDCDVARSLTENLMGRLVPLSVFCLLTDDGLLCTKGILHPTFADGGVDPSVAIDIVTRKWQRVDPAKRPWRNLVSLLSFLDAQSSSGSDCWQIRLSLSRLNTLDAFPRIGIWSGGVKVSDKSGNSFINASDDFVESCVDEIPLGAIGDWFSRFSHEIKSLERLSKILEKSVFDYYFREIKESSTKKDEFSKQRAQSAARLFWELCEPHVKSLVEACARSHANTSRSLRPTFAGIVETVYGLSCPCHTARQIDAWSRHHPNLKRYLEES